MRFLLILVAFLCLGLYGCSRSASVSHTYHQAGVSEAVLDQHLQTLGNTRGVRQVIPNHDSNNHARLQIVLDSKNPYPGREALRDLGYERVRD